MRLIVLATTLIISTTLAGCANWFSTGSGSGKLSLTEAMQQVTMGLNDMTDKQTISKSGLLPSEVTIVFNVYSSTSDKDKTLYVEAAANLADALKIVRPGVEVSTNLQASRGNQVTIKFTNIMFAPKDTLVTTADSATLAAVLKVLHDAGLNPAVPKK